MYSKSLILSSESSASGSKVQARADAPAWVTVDDADPRIQYSSGWQAPTDVGGLLDGTRHGATNAGMTASFRFTGKCPRKRYNHDSQELTILAAVVDGTGRHASNGRGVDGLMGCTGRTDFTVRHRLSHRGHVHCANYRAGLPHREPDVLHLGRPSPRRAPADDHER